MAARRLKVAHLTSVHYPKDTRIFHRECQTLASAGYEVVLIATGTANHTSCGVRFRGVALPANRVERWTRTIWQVIRVALDEKADAYHFHDAELLPAGILLRLLTRKPVVYDAHEDLPLALAGKHWIPQRLRQPVALLAGKVEATTSSLLSAVVAATPAIAGKFNPRRTIVVQNFAPGNEFTPGPLPHQQRPATFVYHGRLTRLRGTEQLYRAIAMLESHSAPELILAGKFEPAALQTQLEVLNNQGRIRFVGWQQRDGLRCILQNARAGLLTLLPVEQYKNAWPVKLFEYMAAGLPVLASDFPLLRSIIEPAGCGIFVDPRSPRDIAAAMTWILEHPTEAEEMGRRGRAAVVSRYCWSQEATKLLDLYQKLCNSEGRGR